MAKYHSHIEGKIIEDGKAQITLCNNPMECSEGCYFAIHKRNELNSDDIVENYEEQIHTEELQIVVGTMEIIPSEANINKYSFMGIEEIVKNLFQLEKEKLKIEVRKTEIYLKVYYRKDDFYSIPTIRIQVIFLNKISDELFAELSGFLLGKLKSIVGTNGKIERKIINYPLVLKEYLKIPLLMGQPEFSKEGIYHKKGFTEEQLVEMNFLFAAPLIKLNFHRHFDYSFSRIFDDLRKMIYSTKSDKIKNEIMTNELHKLILKSNQILVTEDDNGIKSNYFISKKLEEMDEESDVDEEYNDEIDPLPF